ncbi:hypothetical protein [Aquimarina pacifica]|uniref:hypothetical protein n=1 Tax=Aquimarina pacifica TaxID=1296415 RepID=UPI00047191AD|nr:hypothetical protein [Aquimarina pacifica]
METKKKNLKTYLDALVDKDGIKTEVTITMTDQTLIKLILAAMGCGIGLVVIAQLVKKQFPNQELKKIQNQISSIHNTLKS